MGEQSVGAERPTILVVDGDEQTADQVVDFLDDDYAVLRAQSAGAVLDTVDTSVDVVLLDRRMSGGSCEDVLFTIRDRDVNCRVVMVTGVQPDQSVLELPFDEYLVKPVSRDEVRDVVSRMLERNTYDDVIEEVVELASAMATLEAKLTIEELAASDEYARLEANLDEFRGGPAVVDPTQNTYATFTNEKIESLLP